MTHIPYKGGAPAAAALLGGEVSMYIDTATGSLGMIKQGKVKVLGVAARERTPLLPEVPTVEEAGVPGYDLSVWYGFFAPGRTPPAIVRTLHGEFRKALDSGDVKSRFATMGTETVGYGPEEFSRIVKADLQKWASFIRQTGLKLD
jgi:tripartite-type tricarboxylate transporter receptor subunit TctC